MHFKMTRPRHLPAALAAGLALAGSAQAAQVFYTDLIVQSSACVGVDCVSSENFGFDTLRLKENNLRIHFDDTSTSSSFPSVDWRLTANDSANGGANRFSIDDATNGKTIFYIEGNAPSNALRIDSNGYIGITEDNPAVNLHVTEGNTPTLRLEQDTSSGFTAQTWDMAGNEANFFVRDVTHSSNLPLRIKPGTGNDDAIVIAADGDVGFGTDSPAESMHLRGSAGDTKLLVEDINTTETARGLLELRNNGTVFFTLDDSSADGATWNFQNNSTEFRITTATNPGFEFALTEAGALTIAGALTQNSDKNNKMAIEPLDPEEVLAKVAALDVSAWTYKHDAESGIRHIGPMAQDFYALFGTGATEKGISTIDTAGVALAAIKALDARNAELRARIEELEKALK